MPMAGFSVLREDVLGCFSYDTDFYHFLGSRILSEMPR